MLLRVLFVIVSWVGVAQAELRLGVSDANRGAIFYENDQFTGALAALFQCVVEGLEQPYSVVIKPQARFLSDLQNDRIDIVFPFAKTDERDQYALFPETLLTADFDVFTKEPLDDVTEHPNKTFALLRTASYQQEVERRGASVISVQDYEPALKMVIAGRADAAIVPVQAAGPFQSLTEQLNRQPYYQQPVGFYLNRQQRGILPSLNESIMACRPN